MKQPGFFDEESLTRLSGLSKQSEVFLGLWILRPSVPIGLLTLLC